MKGDANQADIFRHFSDKISKSTVVDKKDLPQWVREASSGTRKPKGKDIGRMKGLSVVPGNSIVPGWKGKGKNRRKGKK